MAKVEAKLRAQTAPVEGQDWVVFGLRPRGVTDWLFLALYTSSCGPQHAERDTSKCNSGDRWFSAVYARVGDRKSRLARCALQIIAIDWIVSEKQITIIGNT